MSILVDKNTKVITQGMTGATGTFHTEQALAYLGGLDPRDPLASPVLGDFSGVAPVLIQTGSEEALLSDSTALAEALGLAAVDERLEIWPEMIHVFHAWGAVLGVGLLSTALAYVLYFRILAAAGATNLLLVTFLVGFLPMLLYHLTVRYRLRQRLATSERVVESLRNVVAPRPEPADPSAAI